MAIPLLIIVGPTASGKSKLSVELAKFYDGEIISADSMQIYKYMDIGTAKITDEEKQGIPHYMIDIVEPNVKFSVAEFEKMAKPIISNIYRRNKLPIIVGGTGLYIDSLIYIMNFSDYIGNDDFRSALKNIAEVLGNDYLFNRLKVVDPKTFDKLHPNDLRRIIRALEVYQFTGKPISVYQELSSKRMNPEYDVIMIGLNFRDRNKLYKRIDDRVDIMLKNNLVNEVVNLLKIGYNKYDTSMQALGYKEIAEYLDGNVTFEEAISNLKKRTRRYAKRQITWFKSYKIINWFYVDDYIDFEELKKNIICFLAGKLNFK
ncbi:tRNA (adenosine(37)-N6)-dimethylallyltransferase MiaA [Thermoanaerobacterium thermosaccharolyticum]|uniref:tRNA dimethylallyltransferase n=1 Tax=Thermoanaerobacterium thermosaccharolyticum M0795 TaxID=698948 RepID=L0ILX4_THETR|nr:tRNA (adenosine(37)-N6)-dimethylallyltransferase MiaA [Thermoanaerobacterium thermosaccharolyticum]AGB18977.1 tRNA isopentenyltransferase MiaA [Thermoanaerobacterium thermosaccharolyticum M0795]